MPFGTNTYIHACMHAQELISHKFSLVHIDQNHIIMQTLFSLSFLLELSFLWEFSIYACDNVMLALRHTKLNDFLFFFFLFSCFPLFIALAEIYFDFFLQTKKFLHIFIAFYIWVMMPHITTYTHCTPIWLCHSNYLLLLHLWHYTDANRYFNILYMKI